MVQGDLEEPWMIWSESRYGNYLCHNGHWELDAITTLDLRIMMLPDRTLRAPRV